MKIAEIIQLLEEMAHPSLQESYDNAGLITGNKDWECSGIICSLDATESIIAEAIQKKCNLVIAHHPIIFKGLKRLNGKNYVERVIISAVKHDIAIYAIHTNLDNVIAGVNGRIASVLGLQRCGILLPKPSCLRKLFTFVPDDNAEAVRQAIFDAGGGHIGNYSECSFNSTGTGTFKAGENTDPYVGEAGKQHQENETRIEVLFPEFLERKIIYAMKSAHPYEEVAYDIVPLTNNHPGIGSGLVGHLSEPVDINLFLEKLKTAFNVPVVRHTGITKQSIEKVAICGGAGSFLIPSALASGADVFVTADMKYHEFFDADGRILIADIGHYESEQFTVSLLQEFLAEKFPTFAVLKTEVNTNPVHYF